MRSFGTVSLFAFFPVALAALCAPSFAFADELADARAAYLAAWEAAPLAIRKGLLVTAPAEGFGRYDAKPDARYRGDEPIHVYIEPEGYGWVPNGAMQEFGFTVDLSILRPDGTVMLEQPAYLDLRASSAERPTEFYGVVTVTLGDVLKGDFILEMVLNDIASDEFASLRLPFSVE